MKIDQDYLKGLLEAFEASEEPVVDIVRLQKAGFDYEDKAFLFHMGILSDQGLVEREDRKPGFGAVRGPDGSLGWSVTTLRLTSAGHAFIEALRNQEVWATIKANFKEGSISTLVDVSKKLLDAYTRKKLEQILGTSA
jgi:hypothetical protein